MTLKLVARRLLARAPLADGLFRRFLWSRIHFHEHELKLLAALPPRSIDIAIDVGAAQGSYCWILARKAMQVVAFEPGAQHYRYLRRAAFGSRIEVIHAAVGNTNGEVDLFTPGSDDRALHSATLSRANPAAQAPEASVERVKVVTLDGYLRTIAPGRSVDLLKVDVEGYELEVFEGASHVLAAHHPVVVCEIEARHNPRYPEVFELLSSAGYNCFAHRAGRYQRFAEQTLEALQTNADRELRLSPEYDARANRYINNFVFQHPASRLKLLS